MRCVSPAENSSAYQSDSLKWPAISLYQRRAHKSETESRKKAKLWAFVGHEGSPSEASHELRQSIKSRSCDNENIPRYQLHSREIKKLSCRVFLMVAPPELDDKHWREKNWKLRCASQSERGWLTQMFNLIGLSRVWLFLFVVILFSGEGISSASHFALYFSLPNAHLPTQSRQWSNLVCENVVGHGMPHCDLVLLHIALNHIQIARCASHAYRHVTAF